MERMLHRKLVGMNRVGELQGGMFFWVGGACNGGGGVGSGFIMRQAVLCNRASERGPFFDATEVRHFFRVWASPRLTPSIALPSAKTITY